MKKSKLSHKDLMYRLVETFRSFGFEGTTLSILTQQTGLERASLYHHFPGGKKQMAEAVLDHVLSELNEQVLNSFDGQKDPRTQMNTMFDSLETFYKNGNDMCFVAIFAVGEATSPIKLKLSSAVKKWESLIAKSLTKMNVPSSRKKARVILSTVQGSLVLSHIQNNPKIFKDSLADLKELYS